MASYIIGIASIIGLMVIWVTVQEWWKKSFAEDVINDDALAGRSECGNCGCTTACSNRTDLHTRMNEKTT
ncbi:MAG: hypothetical protein HQ500_09325 [Flavobacteriales bacterium]|nr:hypothetical protein [Flavobacteriales bacterium]